MLFSVDLKSTEILTFQLSFVSFYSQFAGRIKEIEFNLCDLVISFSQPFCHRLDLNSEYLELGFGRGGPLSAASRAKRMRTSFKHHQLRTMKSYFAINHNPDAKDLKQLSQKTGLPKRVLQVSISGIVLQCHRNHLNWI